MLDACRGVVQRQFAWWDALVWAAARQHRIPHILTEDAPDGRVLEGVTCRSPFHLAALQSSQ